MVSRPQRRWRNPRREEAGNPEGRDNCRTCLVENRAGAIPLAERLPGNRCRRHLPEFLEPVDTLFRTIAGNDRGVDGADRDSCDPFRLKTVMAKRLKGTRLIGTKRTAALENEHALRPCGGPGLIQIGEIG